MKNFNFLRPVVAGLLFWLSACAKTEPLTPQITEGQALVAENCLICHSLSSDETSPRPDAPSLDQVLSNYNIDSLTDDFREGVHVGHPDMPDFDFGALGTDEVIAYLKYIQVQK